VDSPLLKEVNKGGRVELTHLLLKINDGCGKKTHG